MQDGNTLSPYRWVIEVLLFLTLIAQGVTWLAPAPILGPIITLAPHHARRRRTHHLDHRAVHLGVLAVGRDRRGAPRRVARAAGRHLADVARRHPQRLLRHADDPARMPRARGRRLWRADRAARDAGDAMVRRARMALHQYGQRAMRLYRADRGVLDYRADVPGAGLVVAARGVLVRNCHRRGRDRMDDFRARAQIALRRLPMRPPRRSSAARRSPK